MNRGMPKTTAAVLQLGVAALALLATGLPCAVAAVDVFASLNADTVAVGETVELTVVVTGTVRGIGEPELPDLDPLVVMSRSSRKNWTFGGGRTSSTVQYIYELQSHREGTFTIAPITVIAGEQALSTRPLTLTVTAATRPTPAPLPSTEPETVPSAPPTGAWPTEPVTATTELDNDEPYVGEQVTLSFKLYHRVNPAGVQYSPPSTEGLVAEALPDIPERQEEIGDYVYGVVERETALFGPAPGEYTIGPAQVDYSLGFFDRERIIRTEPITLKVRALPRAGRPAGFSGAVGQVTASLDTDKTQAKAGEALTARLRIEGTGNLRQLEAPDLTVSGGCKWYSSGEQRRIEPREVDGRQLLGGTVTFEYLLVPQQEGTLRIEPVKVHYFDPVKKRYATATTGAAQVRVLKGLVEEIGAEQGPEDIRYIKVRGGALRARPPVTASWWYWVAQLVPLLGLAAVVRQRGLRLRLEADPKHRRFVQALGRAERRLTDLSRRHREVTGTCEALDEVLTDYVADKLGVAASSLSPEAAERALAEAGAPEDPGRDVGQSLRTLRAGRFAPGAAGQGESDELVRTVRKLITDVERGLQQR